MAKSELDSWRNNLETAKELLLDEQKLITYISVAKDLCIHVNEAKKILTQVLEDVRNKQPAKELNVNHIISGLSGNNSARTLICSEPELETLRTSFNTVLYHHIYSIGLGKEGVDSAALVSINRFNDFTLCPGLIKSTVCSKRTSEDTETLKQKCQVQNTVTETKQPTETKLPLKKEKIVEKTADDKIVKIKTEIISPKKEKSNGSINKTNGSKNKSIEGFFTKSNSTPSTKSNKNEDSQKQTIKTENKGLSSFLTKSTSAPITKPNQTVKNKTEESNKTDKKVEDEKNKTEKSNKTDKKVEDEKNKTEKSNKTDKKVEDEKNKTEESNKTDKKVEDEKNKTEESNKTDKKVEDEKNKTEKSNKTDKKVEDEKNKTEKSNKTDKKVEDEKNKTEKSNKTDKKVEDEKNKTEKSNKTDKKVEDEKNKTEKSNKTDKKVEDEKNKTEKSNKTDKKVEDEKNKTEKSNKTDKKVEDEKMEIDIETTEETSKKSIKIEPETSKTKKKSKSLSQIKKNGKVDKKRKRVLQVSDSDSDDPFSDEKPNDPESEDEIPPTPATKTVKITSGILNPKKRRKIVDKTYTDEDGYILTRKEEIYESCSEDEVVQETTVETVKVEKENVQEANKLKTGDSPKDKKANKVSKKKISPPQKGKQATMMSFFKKI